MQMILQLADKQRPPGKLETMHFAEVHMMQKRKKERQAKRFAPRPRSRDEHCEI